MTGEYHYWFQRMNILVGVDPIFSEHILFWKAGDKGR